MKELMEQAAQFLKDHPEFNEIELCNGFNDRVHLIRSTKKQQDLQARHEDVSMLNSDQEKARGELDGMADSEPDWAGARHHPELERRHD